MIRQQLSILNSYIGGNCGARYEYGLTSMVSTSSASMACPTPSISPLLSLEFRKSGDAMKYPRKSWCIERDCNMIVDRI